MRGGGGGGVCVCVTASKVGKKMTEHNDILTGPI